ncbi:hypothetical protein EMPS_00073 [Entomortierella parvispora]|uniref:Arb2-like domain-containing protein n=1 Tax=Entomortierella parvispora TaxID=205924 RepID=A0A9P3H107_9FUNG|nr:hypothetical protein EMPS_00073 [Entomortierella parvispora]
MGCYRTKAYKAGLVALPIGEPFDASLNLGNVFASPSVESGESSGAALYLFVHDVPEGSENVIPVNSIISKYMSDILGSGSGLIDVAVPSQPTTSAERSRVLQTITTQLKYVWDTYVARAGQKVVLLGVGLGSFAMKSLMESRQDDVKRVVACAFSLQGDIKALPSVGSEFVNWYHENTSVLVPGSHPAITNKKECRGDVMAALPLQPDVQGLNLLREVRPRVFRMVNTKLEGFPVPTRAMNNGHEQERLDSQKDSVRWLEPLVTGDDGGPAFDPFDYDRIAMRMEQRRQARALSLNVPKS